MQDADVGAGAFGVDVGGEEVEVGEGGHILIGLEDLGDLGVLELVPEHAVGEAVGVGEAGATVAIFERVGDELAIGGGELVGRVIHTLAVDAVDDVSALDAGFGGGRSVVHVDYLVQLIDAVADAGVVVAIFGEDELGVALVLDVGELHAHEGDVDRGVLIDGVGAAHQFVGFTLPEDAATDVALIDEADTELKDVFSFAFGGVGVVEGEFGDAVAGDVVAEGGRLFGGFAALLLKVGVLVELVIGLDGEVGLDGLLAESLLGEFGFEDVVDDGFDLGDRVVVGVGEVEGGELRKVDCGIGRFGHEGADEEAVVCALDAVHGEGRGELFFAK